MENIEWPGALRVPAQRGATRVSQLVQELEALSMAHENGELIGSENLLLARFSVSRPTLRQAAKVVDAEALISVRRGLRGGFYATRPDAAHAIAAPARYLRLNDATLEDMHEVGKALLPSAAARAATCEDLALIRELAALRTAIDRDARDDDSARAIIKADTGLDLVISRMTGNPVIVLVIRIAYAFGHLERDRSFYVDTEDRHKARNLQRKLCDAILARDAERGRAANVERCQQIGEWIG